MINFIGYRFIEIFIPCLLAKATLHHLKLISREQMIRTYEDALYPARLILLGIGSGVTLKQKLTESGISLILSEVLNYTGLPTAIGRFFLAGTVRII
jgi:H+/gluconate symporter-like permease